MTDTTSAKDAVAKGANGAAPKAVAKPRAKRATTKASPAAPRRAATKPVAKAIAKPAAGTAKAAVAKVAKAAKAVKPKVVKPAKAAKAVVETKEKHKKTKLVRDSFTMPEPEYAVLANVKKTCIKAGFPVKKSELLRIGVSLIKNLSPADLQKVLSTLIPLKAGRPKKER